MLRVALHVSTEMHHATTTTTTTTTTVHAAQPSDAPTAWPPASLDTTIPLEYPPEKVAMGALWAAVRLVDVTLPLKTGETFAQRFDLDQAEVTGGHAAQASLPACLPAGLAAEKAGGMVVHASRMQPAQAMKGQQRATCSQAGSNAHAVSEQHAGERNSLSATLQMQQLGCSDRMLG